MAHEDLTRQQELKGSSDRAFGLVFSAAALVFACAPLLRGGDLRWWAVGLAVLLALIALTQPVLLAAPNRAWTKLGVLLSKVVSPVALGILFYGVLTPFSMAMRIAGKDPLHLKPDRSAASYWIPRQPPGPRPDSMSNQF